MINCKRIRNILSICIAVLMVFSTAVPLRHADAKTASSARGDTVFMYADDREGKSVLIHIAQLEDIKKLSHGQENGENYHMSYTDNYPTTQYCEGRGITIQEFTDYMKAQSNVENADCLEFSPGGSMDFMATDSYGNYGRNWSYEQLYGADRYYFEGLYDKEKGWKPGWEVAGEGASKTGITLEEYNSKYRERDKYYNDKREVFSGAEPMPVFLATESMSGRTSSEASPSSKEPGLAGFIRDNGGTAAGCLGNHLSDETALRLCLPITEADLMGAHRTGYDNFKWIYNVRLKMKGGADIGSEGTVAAPEAEFSLNGNKLTVSLSCSTPGAKIYYGTDGSPQTLYKGPVIFDITGKDVSVKPVTVQASAVKEGYDDCGILSYQYPDGAPSFITDYSAMAGENLIFRAVDSVSQQNWNSWSASLESISMKLPLEKEYKTVNKSLYSTNNGDRTVTFDKSLFSETGSYSFRFHSKGYSDKSVSITMKKKIPELEVDSSFEIGTPVSVRSGNGDYAKGVSVYVITANGSRTMISSKYLERGEDGTVTIKADYFTSPSGVMGRAGKYTLEFVNNGFSPSSATVEIELKGTISGGNAVKFTDVQGDAWYADAVKFAVENGLFSGVAENIFSPDTSMTRGMFATVIWRMEGSPAAEKQDTFSDVLPRAWYYDAVEWAFANGIVSGTGGGKFSPDASITREQIAVMMCRFAGFKGDDTSPGDNLSENTVLEKFSDASMISGYARESVQWAAEKGYLNGTASGRLDPSGTATRAQVAQILMNYLQAERRTV